MQHRDTDRMPLETGGITIDRKIPLWGLVLVASSVFGQGVLLWNGQQLQAQKLEDYGGKIMSLTAEVKELNAQLSSKASKDNEQDLRLNEFSRRLLILESRDSYTRGKP